jgi:hypothetical protein
VDDAPVPTIPTIARIRLIEPMLAPYYGSGSGETCQSIGQPVPTIPTKDRFALVDPLAVPYGSHSEAHSVSEPLPTVMARDRLGVATPRAEPFVLRNNAYVTSRGPDEPLQTPTSASGGGMLLMEPFIVPNFWCARGPDAACPRCRGTTSDCDGSGCWIAGAPGANPDRPDQRQRCVCAPDRRAASNCCHQANNGTRRAVAECCQNGRGRPTSSRAHRRAAIRAGHPIQDVEEQGIGQGDGLRRCREPVRVLRYSHRDNASDRERGPLQSRRSLGCRNSVPKSTG